MRRAGSAKPEATSAARTRSRASDTALSGSPTTLKAGSPGATWTWTSTARASMPSNATVATRWTMLPLRPAKVAENRASIKNNPRTKPRMGLCYKLFRADVRPHGSEGMDVEGLGKLARWDRPPRAHVGSGGLRSLVRGDELCARGEPGAAHLDRSGNRRAAEQYLRPPRTARARPHHRHLRLYRARGRRSRETFCRQ